MRGFSYQTRLSLAHEGNKSTLLLKIALSEISRSMESVSPETLRSFCPFCWWLHFWSSCTSNVVAYNESLAKCLLSLVMSRLAITQRKLVNQSHKISLKTSDIQTTDYYSYSLFLKAIYQFYELVIEIMGFKNIYCGRNSSYPSEIQLWGLYLRSKYLILKVPRFSSSEDPIIVFFLRRFLHTAAFMFQIQPPVEIIYHPKTKRMPWLVGALARNYSSSARTLPVFVTGWYRAFTM